MDGADGGRGGRDEGDGGMTAIYTLWARLPSNEGAWMIAAEDEWYFEGNPEHCEEKFKEAKEAAERDGNIVREIWINVDQEVIEAAFRPAETDAESVEVRP